MLRANILKAGVGLLALAALAGCGTTAQFSYPADADDLTEVDAGSSATQRQDVAVLPFEDQREEDNSSATLFIAMLPLAPWGYMDYARPDASGKFVTADGFRFDASHDLAEAAATSLEHADLFNDVQLASEDNADQEDLVLKGKVNSTQYNGRIYSYGLSVFGPTLWLFGAPVGSSHSDLDIELALQDTDTGEVVWQKDYDLSQASRKGLYYESGQDVRGYADMMQKIMNQAVQDMSQSVEGSAETTDSQEGTPGL